MALEVISYDGAVVRWLPLYHAELYEVQASREPIINDFTSIYKGKNDFCRYPPKLIGGVRFRVRGRVEGKWSLWSREYIHVFALYVSVNFSFRNGLINWQSDPFSEVSELCIAPKDGNVFTSIFSGEGHEVFHVPEIGKWTYRVRSSRGSVHSEWIYLDVHIELPIHNTDRVMTKEYFFNNYYMRDDAELNAYGVKREIPLW